MLIFDPSAPLAIRLEHSVRAGHITAANAESLIRTSDWVDENRQALFDRFPGQAISVVWDPTLDPQFATYVADTSFAAEAKAQQQSPDLPFVTIDQAARISTLAGPTPLNVIPDLRMLLLRRQDGKANKKQGDDKDADGKRGDDKDEENNKAISESTDEELAKTLKVVCSKTSLAPYAQGLVKIADGNCVLKIWGVDSQATNSSISKANFKLLEKKGAKLEKKGVAKGVATPSGVVDFDKYSGITMRFPRDDGAGKKEIASCTEPFIVTEADILGADQLKATKTRLIWDPSAGTAELQKRPAK
jgi:hypothetical protein